MSLRLSRGVLIPLIVLVIALGVGVAAVVDHRRSRDRINRAELAEWFCTHERTRCGGPDSERMHSAWEERELGYKVAECLLAMTGLVATARLVVLARHV